MVKEIATTLGQFRRRIVPVQYPVVKTVFQKKLSQMIIVAPIQLGYNYVITSIINWIMVQEKSTPC